jgi:carbon storage regulator
MLVLSRRVGEEIVIGGNVRVRVVSASGSKVRLAVSAPKNVRVDRLEVNQRRAEFDRDNSGATMGRVTLQIPPFPQRNEQSVVVEPFIRTT